MRIALTAISRAGPLSQDTPRTLTFKGRQLFDGPTPEDFEIRVSITAAAHVAAVPDPSRSLAPHPPPSWCSTIAAPPGRRGCSPSG